METAFQANGTGVKQAEGLNHRSRGQRPRSDVTNIFALKGHSKKLGLSAFFLNSLHLARVMFLLADAVALLRAQALLRHPSSPTIPPPTDARPARF